MDNTGDIVVGLDLGTTKVVAMVGCKTEDNKIQILGYGHTPSVGVSRGVVINITKASEAVRRAVDEAELKIPNLQINSVYVGIAGHHVKSRRQRGSKIRSNKDEEITKEELNELKNSMKHSQTAPGERIIHVIPQSFILDGLQGINENDIVGMTGTNLDANFHIITANEEALKNIQRSVEKAGLELDGFVLEPLVSAMSVLNEEEKQAGVVLVDIGGGTTDVAIFQDGVLCHTAVIPFAGYIITKDIKDCGGILEKQAEALKMKFGSALPEESSSDKFVSIKGIGGRSPKEISLKNLANIIKARMEEILEGVLFEIKNSGCETFLGGVVLTGGGSKLKYLSQLTDFVTGMESRLGSSNEYLSEDSPAELADPIFSTAVGLVMFGLKREDENREEREEKERLEQQKAISIKELMESAENKEEKNDSKKHKKKGKNPFNGWIVGKGKATDFLFGLLDDDVN